MATVALVPRQDGGFAALSGALVELVQVSTGVVLWSATLPQLTNASTLVWTLPLPYAVRVSRMGFRAPSGGYTDNAAINVAEVAGFAVGGSSSVLQYAPAFATSVSSASFPPAAAVDGWTGSSSTNYMFYHSAPGDVNPAWVATHATPISSSLVLTPRQDCCAVRMMGVAVELLAGFPGVWGGGSGTTIFAAQLPATLTNSNTGQLQVPITPFSIRLSKFSAGGPYNSSFWINLLEIEAFSVMNAGGNRLLGTNCLSSSVYDSDGVNNGCANSVDGIKTGDLRTHTGSSDTEPWVIFGVQGGTAPVATISLTPRSCCCARLAGMKVELIFSATGNSVYSTVIPPWPAACNNPFLIVIPTPSATASLSASPSARSSASASGASTPTRSTTVFSTPSARASVSPSFSAAGTPSPPPSLSPTSLFSPSPALSLSPSGSPAAAGAGSGSGRGNKKKRGGGGLGGPSAARGRERGSRSGGQG